MVKKQQESKLKKPAFKVGVNKPNPSPSVGNKPLFALDTSNRLYKSSFQDSGIQSFSVKSKVDATSKVVNKDELSGIRKQPIIISKPLEAKKESRLQPLNASSKISSFARDGKSTIPSSGLPKPTISRTLSKVPNQQIPVKKNVKSIPKFSKIVVPQQRGNDISVKTKKPESNVSNKPNNDFNLNSFECELSHIEPVKESKKSSFAPEGFMFQPPAELSTSLFLEDGPSAIFMRMKNQFLRTSTPKQSPSNKQFSPKVEENECLMDKDIESLKNSPVQCLKKEDIQCLEKEITQHSEKEDNQHSEKDTKCSKKENIPCSKNEDIPCSKNEDIRCSKNEDIPCLKNEDIPCLKNEDIPCLKNEDIPCLKNEDIPCLKNEDISCSKNENAQSSKNEAISCSRNEDTQCSKNENSHYSKDTNKEFGPLNKNDFEAILSSSLESVVLNDMKFTNCKQSLKFEFPEVGSIQSHEEMLLPSKAIHPECSMATESSPIDNVKLPILFDLVETDKTEINFTDAASADDGKISAIFSKIDSVGCEDKETSDSTHIEPDEIAKKIQGITNGFLQKQEIGLLKIPEVTSQRFRQSQKPTLASINESLENTPKSALKKKFLDNVFTPRRSLRLAKLSGNFNSLENLLVSPKPKEEKDKAGLKESFTPRRSLRLSKFSTEFNSAENLFDIRRPTLYGTPPDEDEIAPKLSSRVTYDFDRLSSETEEEIRSRTTRSGKVSLLYTPPNKSRASIMRQSLKGDLMSFSPNV
ncbi:Translation factor GUF1 like protein [Argiope bruennichi]|uniref:Translation factor GUF1 like protein n=1 Tax=Argiope bruennichi TaxID=94029 RepID=A0A8T0EQ74_ARGBR|nr:Translation factor GUF1 like protein [Argiope bruennichi]